MLPMSRPSVLRTGGRTSPLKCLLIVILGGGLAWCGTVQAVAQQAGGAGSGRDEALNHVARLRALPLPNEPRRLGPEATPPAAMLGRPVANQVEPFSVPAPTDASTTVTTRQAASATALNLESLESMALSCNPVLQRAAALVSAARGRALQDGLYPNPSFGFDGQQIASRGLAEQYGATVAQEFVRPIKLELSRAVALQEAHRLRHEYAAQQQRVLTDVRIGYYQALRAQQQLEVTREIVALTQKAYSVADALLKAMEVGRADVLQADVEVENARIQAQTAENRHRAAWRFLGAVTGQPSLAPQPLSGELLGPAMEFDFEQTLCRLQQSSPEVAAANAAIQRARLYLQRQEVEPRPNVFVEGLVNWQDNGIGGLSDGALTVSLPLPLWNRNQGGVQEARMQLVAAQQQLNQLQRDLRQRLTPAFERYRNARVQLDRYQARILPKAAEALELARSAYQLGETNIVQLLSTQKSYAEFRLAALQSAEALRVAEVEIEGLLLSGSLQQR